jgi:hypothetical protein
MKLTIERTIAEALAERHPGLRHLLSQLRFSNRVEVGLDALAATSMAADRGVRQIGRMPL